jgi:hypothetical protein
MGESVSFRVRRSVPTHPDSIGILILEKREIQDACLVKLLHSKSTLAICVSLQKLNRLDGNTVTPVKHLEQMFQFVYNTSKPKAKFRSGTKCYKTEHLCRYSCSPLHLGESCADSAKSIRASVRKNRTPKIFNLRSRSIPTLVGREGVIRRSNETKCYKIEHLREQFFLSPPRG